MTENKINSPGESVINSPGGNIIKKTPHPFRRVSLYLPMLAGPIAICATIVYCKTVWAGPNGVQGLQTWASTCEKYAPLVLTLGVAVYWGKAIFTRNLSYVVLGVLVGVLLLRELHWRPEFEDEISIKDAVFPLLGICFFWMLMWRDIIDKPTENWLHTIFFVGAIVTYGIDMMITKRLFRFVPGEQMFHTQVEEAVECAGHCMIFLAGLLGSWKRRKIIIKGKSE